MTEEKLPSVTWIGVGAKYGGIIGAVGVETNSCWMVNLETFETVTLNIESIKFGLGLGGGLGGCMVIALNCPHPRVLIKDSWEAQKNIDLSVSLGARWAEFAKSSIIYLKPLIKMGPSAVKGIIEGSKRADDLRNLGHLIYGNYSLWTKGKPDPQIMVVDFPVGGYALELSVTSSLQRVSII